MDALTSLVKLLDTRIEEVEADVEAARNATGLTVVSPAEEGIARVTGVYDRAAGSPSGAAVSGGRS